MSSGQVAINTLCVVSAGVLIALSVWMWILAGNVTKHAKRIDSVVDTANTQGASVSSIQARLPPDVFVTAFDSTTLTSDDIGGLDENNDPSDAGSVTLAKSMMNARVVLSGDISTSDGNILVALPKATTLKSGTRVEIVLPFMPQQSGGHVLVVRELTASNDMDNSDTFNGQRVWAPLNWKNWNWESAYFPINYTDPLVLYVASVNDANQWKLASGAFNDYVGFLASS